MRQYLILVFVSVVIFAFFFTYESEIIVEEDREAEISGIIRRVKRVEKGYDIYINDILIKNFSKEIPTEGYIGTYKGKIKDINYFINKYDNKSYTYYLKSQKINYILYPTEGSNQPARNFYWVRGVFSRKMENILDQMYRADSPLLKALIYGETSELDTELRTNFSRTGTSHILAISGLHTGIILVAFNFIFAILPVRTRGLLGILFLLAYSFLTGMKPAIVRAVLFFGIYYFSFILKRRFNIVSTALLLASIFIAINPYIIYDIGFILSFASVISIATFMPVLSSVKIKGMLAVTLAAQIMVLPVVAYVFKIIPITGILANLVVVPVIGLMMGLLILSIMLYFIAPFLGAFDIILEATIKATVFLKDFVVNTNKIFERLPLAYVENLEIEGYQVVFYYAIILFTYKIWLNYKIEVNQYEIRHLKGNVSKKE